MRRILSILLVAVMILGLCACGNSGSQNQTTPTTEPAPSFMAGFGKVDITPSQLGIEMGGYGNQAERLSKGLASYVYAITVAVRDAEGNTAIMMSVDNCSLGNAMCDTIRAWAESSLDIPRENILISSIHQHSTPDSTDGNYTAELEKGLKKSITAAIEDLAPAEMYFAKTQAPNMTFVRRAWYKDGGFVTAHSGDRSSGFDHYESESDKEMRLVKFTREDKDPILLVNFQGHPHMGTDSTKTDIHSDWPGVMRDQLEKDLGVQCIYFSGAGGNMNSTSYNKADNISADFRQHGQRAANFVKEAEGTYTKAETGPIRCMEQTNTYKVDHTLDHLLMAATNVAAARSNGGMSAAKEEVKKYPELNSVFQASAVVAKAGMGETLSCTLSVITFGDLAFTVHPYEMFDSNGRDLREGTVGKDDLGYSPEDQLENPFPMTIVTSISNGAMGYIPSTLGFSNGGYERDTTKYAQGTGELLVGDYLAMLNQLHD